MRIVIVTEEVELVETIMGAGGRTLRAGYEGQGLGSQIAQPPKEFVIMLNLIQEKLRKFLYLLAQAIILSYNDLHI